MSRTDHSTDIATLRRRADGLDQVLQDRAVLSLRTAADLLEIHDTTGISLDDWPAARGLVELFLGHPITPNGA